MENKEDELKQEVRRKIRQQRDGMKINSSEGTYEFDNPNLEYKTKRQTKLQTLEDKYKDKPKIVFHTLTDEGNRQFMQIKRDKVWTTLYWSCIGNFAGILITQFMDGRLSKFKALRHLRRREGIKVATFISTVAAFTYFGFGKARQEFVRQKLKIVEDHSIEQKEK